MNNPDYAPAFLASALPYREEIAKIVRPALFGMVNSDGATTVGASRIGGQPDLPAELQWPEWGERKLQFVAQINLAELPAVPERELLPQAGWLWFFWFFSPNDEYFYFASVPEEQPACQVWYWDGPASALSPRDFPEELDDPADFCEIRGALTFQSFRTFPGYGHPSLHAFSEDPRSHEDVWNNPTIAAIREVQNKAEDDYTLPSLVQVLGYPREMQNEVTRGVLDQDCNAQDVSRDEFVEKAGQWVLLLQCHAIGGDFSLYVMIRKADLAAKRFDRIGWEVQTT